MDLNIFTQNNFKDLIKFVAESKFKNIGLQFDFKGNGISLIPTE